MVNDYVKNFLGSFWFGLTEFCRLIILWTWKPSDFCILEYPNYITDLQVLGLVHVIFSKKVTGKCMR